MHVSRPRQAASGLLLAMLLATPAAAAPRYLGSWTFYLNPGLLSGSATAEPVTALTVRLAFGPNADFDSGLELFDLLLAQDDDGRAFVADAASVSEYGQIAAQLTNGDVSDKMWIERGVLNAVASGGRQPESYWAGFPTSAAPADFQNYRLDRLELVTEKVFWTVPGSNPNGDGNWVDYNIDVRLDFYGTLLPEPTSGAISALLAACLGQRGRGHCRVTRVRVKLAATRK